MNLADTQTNPGGYRPANWQDGFTLIVVGGNHDGKKLQSQVREITIGSDPDSTFVFDRPDISPLHCLVVQDHTSTLIDARQGNVNVNGERISSHSLKAGDRIQLGDVHLHVKSVAQLLGQAELKQSEKENAKLINQSRRIGRNRVLRLIKVLRDARQTIDKQRTFLEQFCRHIPGVNDLSPINGHNSWLNMICDLDLDEIDPEILSSAIFDQE